MNSLWSCILSVRYNAGRLLGLAGVIGAVLSACAMLLIFVLAPKWRGEAVQMRRETAHIARDVKYRKAAFKTAPDSGLRVSRFTGIFPFFGQNASDLQQLFEQAEKAKVQLDKGEYQFISGSGDSFVNYEVVLPVKANYATIRGYVAAVLNAVPHASLSELRMERSSVGSDILEARIRFTLTYRGA